MASYYEVLNVARDAADVVIEAAYRALMKRHHPDLDRAPGAEARAKAITEAYRTLKDPAARARYDLTLGPAAAPRRPRVAAGAVGERPAPGGAIVRALFLALAALVILGVLGSLAGLRSPGP
jgi:DnaJ-class molecular chaperone